MSDCPQIETDRAKIAAALDRMEPLIDPTDYALMAGLASTLG